MRQKSLIAVVVGVTTLVLGAVGAYAWDASRDDLIAVGVRVGGVDVGGLRATAARERLDRDLVRPLSRPVRVTFKGRRYTLTAGRARLRTDLDGMVAEALAASRRGGLPGRLWRSVTGAEVERDLPPRVAYSQPALEGFISEVARKIGRRAHNATVEPTASSLTPVASQTGRRLRREHLREALRTELESQAGGRVVEARVRTIKPKVTTRDLAEAYPYYIVVNRDAFKLLFFKDLKLAKTFRISVGQVGYDTPTGLYHVQNKQVNPTWHVPNREWAGKLAGKVIPGGRADNPLKARWMGIFNGAGIHGTDSTGSLGRAASHGCIRMAIPDVVELYDQIPVQTPVFIA